MCALSARRRTQGEITMTMFVNAFTWKRTPDMSQLPAEQAWVGKMMEKGLMLNFFLAADMSKGWQVWSVDSAAQIFQESENAPLGKFMSHNLTQLAADPRAPKPADLDVEADED
jgi:hypothetical protein